MPVYLLEQCPPQEGIALSIPTRYGQQEIGIPSYGVDSNKPWLVWVSLINCFGKYVRFECGGCYSGMGSTLCEVEYPGKKEYTSTLKAKKLQYA